jgi:hypothetical protein
LRLSHLAIIAPETRIVAPRFARNLPAVASGRDTLPAATGRGVPPLPEGQALPRG